MRGQSPMPFNLNGCHAIFSMDFVRFFCFSVDVDLAEDKAQADRYSTRFENNCFTEMCIGSDAGSCVRLIDFV